MLEIDPSNAFVYPIGGAGALTLIVFFARKAWQQVMGTAVDQAKAAADAVVYNNLKEEVARISSELKDIKLEHKKEKVAFEYRIVELETKVMGMSYHIGNVRKLALDAYAKLLQDPPEIKSAIIDIQTIIKDE